MLYVAADADAAQRERRTTCGLLRAGCRSPGPLGQGDRAPLTRFCYWPRRTARTRRCTSIAASRTGEPRRSFQLASGRPWRALVVSAQALLRRAAPRRRWRAAGSRSSRKARSTSRRRRGGSSPRAISACPSSKIRRASRCAAASSTSGLRARRSRCAVELYGDMVVTLRTFNPDDQRTLATLPRVIVPPAREAIIDRDSESRARGLLRDLCDQCDYPSSKARSLIDDVSLGRAFFGADGYLPGVLRARLDRRVPRRRRGGRGRRSGECDPRARASSKGARR